VEAMRTTSTGIIEKITSAAKLSGKIKLWEGR
jgi:hypothetical protein